MELNLGAGSSRSKPPDALALNLPGRGSSIGKDYGVESGGREL